ncbi:MAG: hypothetical protein AB7G28_06060 [Pirellulales bacterium]
MLPALATPTAATVRQPVSPPRPHCGTEPFARFGRWVAPVSVARDGTIPRLARWLALNRRAGDSAAALWDSCRAANPECFRTYRVVTLDEPSFFLPAGDVAFEVIENPTQIPERPPQGVMLRHLEAMDAFASATFYFLRPVFVAEPNLRLCSVAELRREAHFDQFDAFRRSRHLGWAYRSQAWLARQRDAAAVVALRALTRVVEELAWTLAPAIPGNMPLDTATRRRLRRQLQHRLDRTESLGLVKESRRLQFALDDLRRRITIDPVLVFEVNSRPGELWFEAHWFAGNDGRTYVHY